MSKENYNYILGGILILFGVIFILTPQSIFETIVIALGALIISFCIFRIIFHMRNRTEPMSSTFLILGIIFGFILIYNSDSAVKTIPFLLGIYLFTSGLSNLFIVSKSSKNIRNISKPLIKTILGFICFMTPVIPIKITGIVIGIFLVLSGITIIINKKESEVVYKVRVKK